MGELKGWRDMPIGGLILEAGNSETYETGSWRTFRPVRDAEKCVHCLFCWMFCPDMCILVEGGKVKGVNLTFCKGCGICAAECPKDAIEMVKEEL
jgi:pyruvate ferredoxin oxidoreductase delta subunit